jgi:serine/threonine-protein kinase HipA
MRQARILYDDKFAGILTETDEGQYTFTYDAAYVTSDPTHFLTFTMSVRPDPYVENRLFPFFEGLIPEGWLLDIATRTWRVNPNDRMGLLLVCCRNCIGAISVEPINESADV